MTHGPMTHRNATLPITLLEVELLCEHSGPSVGWLVGWSVGRLDGLLGGRRSVIISKKSYNYRSTSLVCKYKHRFKTRRNICLVYFFFCNGESGATHELLMHLAVLKWAKNV